jgi:hypothetical protein
VNFQNLLNHLQLDNHFAFDQQIYPVTALDFYSVVTGSHT